MNIHAHKKANRKGSKMDRVFSRGCRSLLLALLEKDRRWSELEKIADKRTVSECIDLLIELGFVKATIDYSESPKGIKKYALTKRGTIFAQKLKELSNLLVG
jgi:tRNA nucleotidyltransferase/poly(A) polymerase